MTLQDVVDAVAVIKAHQDDPEVAHGYEDGLWHDVLQHIANGGDNPSGYAEEALKTLKIRFPRWRA